MIYHKNAALEALRLARVRMANDLHGMAYHYGSLSTDYEQACIEAGEPHEESTAYLELKSNSMPTNGEVDYMTKEQFIAELKSNGWIHANRDGRANEVISGSSHPIRWERDMVYLGGLQLDAKRHSVYGEILDHLGIANPNETK